MRSPLRPPAAVGFIGVGNMGRLMAPHLVAAGYRVYAADNYEETLRKFLAAHRGTIALSYNDHGAALDAVITMLPDGNVVRDVLLGGGLADRLRPGTIVIDMSSSDPVGTRALGEVLAKRDVHLVDAPVSGGVKRAADASLATMIGGTAEIIERARPLIATMAKQVFLTGPLGSGHAMKALNNLVSAAGLWIAAEALLAGKQFGLAPETMVDVLNASTGRNTSTENKFKQQILSRGFASGFSLGLMAKDLRTAERLAKTTGAFSQLTQLCAKIWGDAAQALGEAEDHTAVVKFLERASGTTLGP